MNDVAIVINDPKIAREIAEKVVELYLDPYNSLTKEESLRKAIRDYKANLKNPNKNSITL